jgi:hypothetical protein
MSRATPRRRALFSALPAQPPPPLPSRPCQKPPFVRLRVRVLCVRQGPDMRAAFSCDNGLPAVSLVAYSKGFVVGQVGRSGWASEMCVGPGRSPWCWSDLPPAPRPPCLCCRHRHPYGLSSLRTLPPSPSPDPPACQHFGAWWSSLPCA